MATSSTRRLQEAASAAPNRASNRADARRAARRAAQLAAAEGSERGDAPGAGDSEDGGGAPVSYDSACEAGTDCADCEPREVCQGCPQVIPHPPSRRHLALPSRVTYASVCTHARVLMLV